MLSDVLWNSEQFLKKLPTKSWALFFGPPDIKSFKFLWLYFHLTVAQFVTPVSRNNEVMCHTSAIHVQLHYLQPLLITKFMS